MTGAFSEPVDGAALVFRMNNPAVPRRLAQEDPYVKNGLVKDWRVCAWNAAIGG